VSSSFLSRIVSRIKKSRDSRPTTPDPETAVAPAPEQTVKLPNPLDNFYRYKAETKLSVLYRFALQTRSLAIRDTFARSASVDSLSLESLLTVIEDKTSQDLTDVDKYFLSSVFNSKILLALADLLVNTARNDLDTQMGVSIYDFVGTVYGHESFEEESKLLYVEALNELERYEQSSYLASEFKVGEIAPFQEELLELQKIRRASPTSPLIWLDAINKIYRKADLAQIQLLDDAALPLMDRLSGEGSNQTAKGPKVSVILPTYSPKTSLKTAIRSLIEQTWQNLEIIIVDDGSPENFRDIFHELATLDPRIRVLHLETNSGPYVARNAGLKIATGEYITTHDDDDWSHPDKIKSQMDVMLKRQPVVATTSAHIRATHDMFLRRVNTRATFLQINYSSLLFRKSLVDEIGPWDTVNRGGDSEFLTRLIEYVGEDKVINLIDKPLSFSRVWDGSLTSGEMSRGYFAYSRLLYRWSFRQWHWNLRNEGRKAILPEKAPRPYAVPTTFEAGRRNEHLGHFDVIFVSDFSRQAKFADSVLDDILALPGLRVGYMHLQSPQTERPSGFVPRLFEAQRLGYITQVSHDDFAVTDLLVVYDASIGMFLDRMKTSVVCHQGIVVEHEPPSLSTREERTPTSILQAVQSLDAAFGTAFKAVGATFRDHRKLLRILPNSRVLEDKFVWTQHVQGSFTEIEPPDIRPIVGFHCYGNHYRWPTTEKQFEDVFVNTAYSTRLYGNLKPVRDKFEEDVLDNIELVDQQAESESEFLASLDFWLYFPNAKLEDQIWKHVLMAMLAGKVVILSEQLRPLYGSAALYGQPKDVAQIVSEYSQDSEKYLRQAQLGQEFVSSSYTDDRFYQRIATLLPSRSRRFI